MTDEEWGKIRQEYIRGASQRALGEKYGVSPSTIAGKALREKWEELRGQSRSKARAREADRAAKDMAVERSKVHEAGVALLDKAIEAISGCTDAATLRNLSMVVKNAKDILDMRSAADTQEQEARILRLRAETEARKHDQDGGGIIIQLGGDVDEYGG